MSTLSGPSGQEELLERHCSSLQFTVTEKEGASVLRDTSDISYHGHIVPEKGKSCWISFPGKFAAGWDALIKEFHGDSVACVFLCTPKDGLGKHHTDPEDPQKRCLCHKIYGERDYKRFGYLQKMAPPYTEERIRKAKEKADAMNAVHIRGDATEQEMSKAIAEAQGRWWKSGKVASWGCEWYHASLLHLALIEFSSLVCLVFMGFRGEATHWKRLQGMALHGVTSGRSCLAALPHPYLSPCKRSHESKASNKSKGLLAQAIVVAVAAVAVVVVAAWVALVRVRAVPK